MVVHPIVIRRPTLPSTSTPGELIIFLHGRLEADEHESNISIPDPSELYIDFLSNLYDKLPPNSQILMPAYHEHYKDWKREPRDLTLGPVSSAIGQAIHDHIEEMQFRWGNDPVKATVISFSMGAAVLLRLLANGPILSGKKSCVEIQRLILIEPVWRCWLPFAVSEANTRIGDPAKCATAISDVPALAIAGSGDDEVRCDSGCMGQRNMDCVRRSLKPFLPSVRVAEIEGGNHFGGVCSGLDNIVTHGLGGGVALPGLQAEIIGHIVKFLSVEVDQ